MRQIRVILWDSYRLLTAKKLFWVTLGISLFVAFLYASIGFNDQGMSFFFGLKKIEYDLMGIQGEVAKVAYMKIFTDWLVPWWLGCFSLVLALISVSSVFPDFLQKGSIDVAVSKPISRVALFLTKYLGCLLFVAIQVTVFCLICYIAQGARLGHWGLQIFWAVPLLVFAFSLIFCIPVLTAIRSNSTIFALLMALVMWGLSSAVYYIESGVFQATYSLNKLGEVMSEEETLQVSDGPYNVAKTIAMPFPKTQKITYMIKDKVLVEGVNMSEYGGVLDLLLGGSGPKLNEGMMTAVRNRHSMTYIIGSSLLFNLAILSLACWSFVRKDF